MKPKSVPLTNVTKLPLLFAVRNLADGFGMAGAPLTNNSEPTLVYNDNETAVNWASTTTMKNVRQR